MPSWRIGSGSNEIPGRRTMPSVGGSLRPPDPHGVALDFGQENSRRQSGRKVAAPDQVGTGSRIGTWPLVDESAQPPNVQRLAGGMACGKFIERISGVYAAQPEGPIGALKPALWQSEDSVRQTVGE